MATPYGQGRVYNPNVNSSTSQNSTTVAGNLNNTTGSPQNTISQGGMPTGVPTTNTGRVDNTDIMNKSIGGNSDLQNVSIPQAPVQPQNSPNTIQPATNTTNTTPVEVPNQTSTSQPNTTTVTPNVSNVAANQILNNQQNEVTIPLPSKEQLRKMTKEELIGIKSYLKHCYKESLQKYDIFNVKRYAKECIKSHNVIPTAMQQYYPDVINSNIKSVYNKLLDLSNIKDSNDLRMQAQTSLDYTMKLLSNSTDWIGIVLSKKLGDWSYIFKNTKFQDLTIGKFFMIAALCASLVYLLEKHFKSKNFLGIGDRVDFSENTNIFESISLNESDADSKLNEYSNKEIPTDILMINSIVLKSSVTAITRLQSLAYQNLNDFEPVNINVLVLTEICCSIVLLWEYMFGMKLKKAKTVSAFLYECFSPKLIETSIIPIKYPTKVLFKKLKRYAVQQY